MGRHPDSYVSEADFVCRFLVRALDDYSESSRADLECHVEEPIAGAVGEGLRADLTVRQSGRRLLVVEAKLDTDPWHWEVVEEAFGYSTKFDFFATCNPRSMVLFASGPRPFESGLALLDYGSDWTARLFDLMARRPSPKSLYRGLLVQEGILDAGQAKLYEEVRKMNEVVGEGSARLPEAPYRLVATKAPKGFVPGSMGWYWDLETAKHNKAVLEEKGFRITVQKRDGMKWKDLDDSQTKLGG